jgi:hypothetical protein
MMSDTHKDSLIIVIVSVSPAAIREAARVGAERKEA